MNIGQDNAACRALMVGVPLFVLCGTAVAQTTWHVDDDCSPPGTGTPANPYCTIQDAVDASQNGDTVLVAPGTYTGQGNRDISLFGKLITLKSAGGPTETIVDSQGSPSAVHRSFFLIHGETSETVIEGFTITGGYLIGDTGGSGAAGGGGGAGIYIRDSSPTIRNCIVRDNISNTLGQPLLVDGRAAGIYIDGNSTAVIDDCVMLSNSSEKRGGAMYIGYDNSSVTVRNCLIASNYGGGGGGIYNTFGNSVIVNTTIAENAAGAGGGGGFVSENSDAFLGNCVLWNNQAEDGPQIALSGPRMITIEYSIVEGGPDDVQTFNGEINWGLGNIDADPLFFDPENGDYHLLPGSPCVDAGNNLAVPDDVTTDLDGRPRFLDDPNVPDTGNPDGINPIVDMGPYEHDPQDCNHNGILDAQDIAQGNSDDCNDNQMPDECEADCNDNNQQDACDIAQGVSEDCTANGIPDECEPDCNNNSQADSCDIDQGLSEDCTANGIPDECEPDCNNNRQADSCDISDALSEDCNTNGVPDECEPDCNANGQADACDITAGLSDDCNTNLIPDECEEGVGPDVTQQPQDQEAAAGDMAVFFIEADGALPEYQWRKDGVAQVDTDRILGTTGPTLAILDVHPSDAGQYDCVVTDILECFTISEPAVLSVILPCPADLNGDGVVDVSDLGSLLGAWGPNPAHPADINGDGTVEASDLAKLLGSWGMCQ